MLERFDKPYCIVLAIKINGVEYTLDDQFEYGLHGYVRNPVSLLLNYRPHA